MADDEKRGVNIANGVISGLVIACGIIYSVLSGVYVDSVLSGVSIVGLRAIPLWSVGFAYIIPGLLGLIGTFTKSKCAYIVQMVFCILTLLVMGIFVIIALLALTGLTYVSALCSASSQGSCSVTATSYYAVIYSMSISMVIGWVLTLVITILGGILACRQPTSQGQVMVPMSPMTVVSTTTNMQPSAYQGNLAYSANSAYTQGTGYPDSRAFYTQGTSYPDNRSYTQGTSYPDNRSYKQGTSYLDNRSYTQGSGYPDNRSYSQETRYHDNRSYEQISDYPAYARPSGNQSNRDWREKY